VFLNPSQMTFTTELPFGIWCWNCSNLPHCQTPQCFCGVIFFELGPKLNPYQTFKIVIECVFFLWSFVFNELIYFIPHYQMPSHMKPFSMHYNKLWFFKRCNLTKALATIKWMSTLIIGMGHKRYMVFFGIFFY